MWIAHRNSREFNIQINCSNGNGFDIVFIHFFSRFAASSIETPNVQTLMAIVPDEEQQNENDPQNSSIKSSNDTSMDESDE